MMMDRFIIRGFVLTGLLATGWLLGVSQAPLQLVRVANTGAVAQPITPVVVHAPANPEIVNPSLASLALHFQPTAGESKDITNPSVILTDKFNERNSMITNTSPLALTMAGQENYNAFALHKTAVGSDTLIRDWYSTKLTASSDAGGWADGFDRYIVPVPGLNWQTDWNSEFSLRFSHQTWRESTDIGVMGMFSVEF